MINRKEAILSYAQAHKYRCLSAINILGKYLRVECGISNRAEYERELKKITTNG